MSLQSIKRQPAEQLAAQALRDSIMTGELRPGTRITETALAEQFEVSRGTVRIALHQLSRDGLVVQTPYTGWAVMQITPRDVWELYTLRAALEALAARLASEQLDEAGAARLAAARDALFAACTTGDIDVISSRDFELHQCIVALAQNARLSNQYRMVEQQVRFFVTSTYELMLDVNMVIDHHGPIVEAILRKDAQAAAALTEEHTISEGKKLMRHLESKAAGTGKT